MAAAEWPPITFVVVSAPRLPIEDMFLSGAVEGRERERPRETRPSRVKPSESLDLLQLLPFLPSLFHALMPYQVTKLPTHQTKTRTH